MPLPNTRVIHPLFEAHHEPVARGTLTGEVRVSRPDTVGVRDPDTGKTSFAPPMVIYTGPARIQEVAIGGAQPVTAADRNANRVGYRVVVARSAAPILARDIVEVLNPTLPLNDVTLSVRSATRGTLLWETDLRCELLLPTNAGGGQS